MVGVMAMHDTSKSELNRAMQSLSPCRFGLNSGFHRRRNSRVAAVAGKMLTTGVTLNKLYTLLSELRMASRNGSLVVDTCSNQHMYNILTGVTIHMPATSVCKAQRGAVSVAINIDEE